MQTLPYFFCIFLIGSMNKLTHLKSGAAWTTTCHVKWRLHNLFFSGKRPYQYKLKQFQA